MEILKTNKKILLFITIGLVAIAVSVTAYRMNQKSNNAKETYLRAEASNFVNYTQDIKRIYNDFYNSQKPYMDNKYKKRVEISANISSDSNSSSGLGSDKAIFDIIKKGRLLFDYNNDFTNKQSLTQISVLMQKTPLLDATIFSKDNKIGIEIPVLLPDKQFIISSENLDKLYNKFELPVKPKILAGPVEIANILKYSGDNELDAIIKAYGTIIAGIVEENDVKYGNETSIKVGDTEKKGREVIISLNPDKSKKLFTALTNKLSTDDALLRLTYENYADLIKLLDDFGIFGFLDFLHENQYLNLADSTKSFLKAINFKKDVTAFKASIETLGTNFEFTSGINIIAIIDGSNNLLERKISFEINNNKNKKYLINLESGINDIKNQNFKNMNWNLNITDSNQFSIKTQHIISYNAKTDTRSNFDINYTKYTNSLLNFNSNLKYDIEANSADLEEKKKVQPAKGVINYQLKFRNHSSKKDDIIWGNLESESTEIEKLSTKNINTIFNMNLDMPSKNIKDTKIVLNFKKMHKLNSDFSIPEFETGKIVDFDKMSDSQYNAERSKAFAALVDFYIKNKPMINQ